MPPLLQIGHKNIYRYPSTFSRTLYDNEYDNEYENEPTNNNEANPPRPAPPPYPNKKTPPQYSFPSYRSE